MAETLMERVLADIERESPETAPAQVARFRGMAWVEVSEAFDYYAARTPPEGTSFDLAAFPGVRLDLGGLRMRSAFVEGRSPRPQGARGDLVGRMGFGVDQNGPPFLEGWQEFYEDMGIPRGREVLHLNLFWDGGGPSSTGPGVVFFLPLAEDGHPERVESGNGIAMGEIVPGIGPRTKEEADEIARTSRDPIFMCLFALACLCGVRPGGARLDDASHPADGREGRVLRLDGLGERLTRVGGAEDLGLGHAMTVCREDFLPEA